MRDSTSHLDQRVRHSRLGSWLSAGNAVEADIPLDDYLIYKSREYEARYRKSRSPLPSTVAIMDGHLERIPNADYESAWEQIRDDLTEEETSELFPALSETGEITRDVQELDEEDAWLRGNQLTIRDQQEALADAHVDAIATGRMSGPTTTRRRGRGRRPFHTPFPWLIVPGFAAMSALLLVETYQLALPMLDAIGVDTSRLGSEWSLNPLGVFGGVSLALAASAGLFFLWYLIIRSACAFVRSVDSGPPLRIVRRGVGVFCLGVALLAGSLVIATLRHGMTTDGMAFNGSQQGMGTGVFLFLTLLVPFASAYVHYRTSQNAYWERRREIIAAHEDRVWDEEERRVPAETLADRMQLILQRRAVIEKARAQLRARRSVLARRAQALQSKRLARLQQAQRSTEAYARTLLKALEQDRYSYLCAAHRSHALHLVPAALRGQCPITPHPGSVIRALLTSARNGHGAKPH